MPGNIRSVAFVSIADFRLSFIVLRCSNVERACHSAHRHRLVVRACRLHNVQVSGKIYNEMGGGKVYLRGFSCTVSGKSNRLKILTRGLKRSRQNHWRFGPYEIRPKTRPPDYGRWNRIDSLTRETLIDRFFLFLSTFFFWYVYIFVIMNVSYADGLPRQPVPQ